MGLKKLIEDSKELEHIKKKAAVEELKAIDKKSTKVADLAKRLEIIEKILGLDE